MYWTSCIPFQVPRSCKEHILRLRSIPSPLYWPTFIAANVAAIIASQAMISGAFAIVSQPLSLSCFPRVKVVHTSANDEGQVYIPEINYFLMIACIIVTYSFKTTKRLAMPTVKSSN